MTSRDAILGLLAERAAGDTICPSEAARRLQPDAGEWRGAMPRIHQAVDDLLLEGLVTLSWKGRALSRRAGPYRIARRE